MPKGTNQSKGLRETNKRRRLEKQQRPADDPLSRPGQGGPGRGEEAESAGQNNLGRPTSALNDQKGEYPAGAGEGHIAPGSSAPEGPAVGHLRSGIPYPSGPPRDEAGQSGKDLPADQEEKKAPSVQSGKDDGQIEQAESPEERVGWSYIEDSDLMDRLHLGIPRIAHGQYHPLLPAIACKLLHLFRVKCQPPWSKTAAIEQTAKLLKCGTRTVKRMVANAKPPSAVPAPLPAGAPSSEDQLDNAAMSIIHATVVEQHSHANRVTASFLSETLQVGLFAP